MSVVLAITPYEEDKTELKRILAGSRVRLDAVSTVAQARTWFTRNSDALVVCESRLPDGDWRDVLESLSEIAGNGPLIVASAYADERLWGEVLNLGGFDVLMKPFSEDEVSRVVRLATRKQPALAGNLYGQPLTAGAA